MPASLDGDPHGSPSSAWSLVSRGALIGHIYQALLAFQNMIEEECLSRANISSSRQTTWWWRHTCMGSTHSNNLYMEPWVEHHPTYLNADHRIFKFGGQLTESSWFHWICVVIKLSLGLNPDTCRLVSPRFRTLLVYHFASRENTKVQGSSALHGKAVQREWMPFWAGRLLGAFSFHHNDPKCSQEDVMSEDRHYSHCP